MPIVPMFHVNARGMPYACPMAGAKLVFPGNKMGDGATLAALINAEERARTDRLGLWADPHPVPPWEWRQGAR